MSIMDETVAVGHTLATEDAGTDPATPNNNPIYEDGEFLPTSSTRHLTRNPAYGLKCPFGVASLTAAEEMSKDGNDSRRSKSSQTMEQNATVGRLTDVANDNGSWVKSKATRQQRLSVFVFTLSLLALSFTAYTVIVRRRQNVAIQQCVCSNPQLEKPGLVGGKAVESNFSTTVLPESPVDQPRPDRRNGHSPCPFASAHVVTYLKRRPDGKFDHHFSSTRSSDGSLAHAFLDNITLLTEEVHNASLLIEVSGLYYAYGQLNFADIDCRHEVYELHLLLNNRRMASSFRATATIPTNQTKGKAQLRPNRQCGIETLFVGRLMQLFPGDSLRLEPGGNYKTPDGDRVGLAARGNYFGLYTIPC